MMVTSRSAVASACWLILAFVGAAGLFAALRAPFLAVLQVLIYAGAIMVLFLFVIMMLQRTGPGGRAPAAAQGLVAPGRPAGRRGDRAGDRPDVAAPRGSAGASRPLRRPASARRRGVAAAVGNYLLAFELISVVLLVAIIGALASARGKGNCRGSDVDPLSGPGRRVFLTGMVGFIVRRNALVMMMCVELMLCAVQPRVRRLQPAARRCRRPRLRPDDLRGGRRRGGDRPGDPGGDLPAAADGRRRTNSKP